MLALEDLANRTEEQVLEHIKSTFQLDHTPNFRVLVAYESVGSCGYDSDEAGNKQAIINYLKTL